MEISTLLAALGILATVVFGFLSIELFKRKKNPGKITMLKQSTIGLFNNIAKNFDEISILYKDEPIKENVIYLKACFVNDGDIDIDGSVVEKTVNLNLKEGFRWIKSKVTNASPELKSDSLISENKQDLKFNFGLVRKKEFFQFEALIEIDNSEIDADDIYENIEISHRIANTQKINVTALLSDEQLTRKKKKMKSFGFMIGFQFLLLAGMFLVQTLYIKDAPIYYKSTNGVTYSVKAKSDEKIKLKDIDSKEKSTITITEFQTPNKYIPFVPQQTLWEKLESTAYIIPLLLILLVVFIGGEYIELRKSNKFYNIFDGK
jgi:hypothetical protein